jgi:hypothetical protein
VIKLLHRPLGLVVSLAGGIGAAALFKDLVPALGHDEEARRATERDFSCVR